LRPTAHMRSSRPNDDSFTTSATGLSARSVLAHVVDHDTIQPEARAAPGAAVCAAAPESITGHPLRRFILPVEPHVATRSSTTNCSNSESTPSARARRVCRRNCSPHCARAASAASRRNPTRSQTGSRDLQSPPTIQDVDRSSPPPANVTGPSFSQQTSALPARSRRFTELFPGRL
jgi:hypothetical protein